MSDHDDGGFDDELVPPDDAIADQVLRDLLTRIPHDPDAIGEIPADALAEIDRAVTAAWPDDRPPNAEQIAREDGDDPFLPHDVAPDHPWSDDVHPGHDAYGHEDSHGGHEQPDDRGHHGHDDGWHF
ncbi:hypothetical protein [Mycobacterium sp. 852002-51057_SCH5723018]|uniref:hypothetical protein n=1 Tax=Mycobacterium sp. 852002-51057_SCH5723018 TaxID=1834094 RepID=UPI00080103DB|nr:hypothetical protein [Mycobacterium sp. 852002-51057_SCH5723018]OBG29601.1 hypothetical protein A5764_21655 [Mycobacterium sp. 852002-51057_SCH5723018]